MRPDKRPAWLMPFAPVRDMTVPVKGKAKRSGKGSRARRRAKREKLVCGVKP